MEHVLPELPYAQDALAPYMSQETLLFHHGRHHAKYVATLNDLIKGTGFEGTPLDELVVRAEPKTPIYNNALQHWNHSFFWPCLAQLGGDPPSGAIGTAIARDFGSFEGFKKEFAETAMKVFGSGWAWLVSYDGTLQVVGTSNADNPMREGKTPLLTLDVWEHAYYIDYRNDRAKYIDTFWSLADWGFAERNLANASAATDVSGM